MLYRTHHRAKVIWVIIVPINRQRVDVAGQGHSHRRLELKKRSSKQGRLSGKRVRGTSRLILSILSILSI